MGGPWKYTCNSSVLRCTSCGQSGYTVRWACLGYVLDILCGTCWNWANRLGLR